jgi:hypothetical protein
VFITCEPYLQKEHRFSTKSTSLNLENVCRAHEDVIIRENVTPDGDKYEKALKVITIVFIGADAMIVRSTDKIRSQLGM